MVKTAVTPQYPAALINRASEMHRSGVSLSALAGAFQLRPSQLREVIGVAESEGKASPVGRGKVQGLATPEVISWLQGLPFSSNSYVSRAVLEFHEKYKNHSGEGIPNA
jgi:hypothetical protein